ncbi:MAG: small multi-drug export protein [Erysipelothrix sp.]|nr:small multi-drug export protein [Erysipelothrix sp.]
MIDLIVNFFKGFPSEVIVLILSMIPVIELRGGIPAAYAMGLPLFETLPLAIIGNTIPVPFIILFIKQIFKFMKKHNILSNLIDKITQRALDRSDKVESMEFWGLMIIVAIPLPGTGAWTGALIAALIDLDFKRAMLSIGLGVIVSAIIVSFLTYGVFNFFV